VRDTAAVLRPSSPIVVGIDGSAASDAALAWACDEARLRGLPVIALHVIVVPYELPRIPVDVPESELERKGMDLLDEAVQRAPSEGVALESRVLEGSPSELLLEASEEASLLVVGTRDHGKLVSIVGESVSANVALRARCPVVVVHV
jgi:nucleotide-binding universal stress UspA family protein